QGSRDGCFLGFPTAAGGAFLYGAVGVLAVPGVPAQRWTRLYVLAGSGAAISGYLTYLELFVIHALCFYGLAAALVSIGLRLAVIVRRPHGAGRQPTRLAVGGVATAVFIIVVGAGIPVGAANPERVAYQEALARPPSDSGAIMYGAYW